MSVRKPKYEEIYYPESDGEPMGETDSHCNLMFDLRFALENFFREDPGVYISGNIFLYYTEGNPGDNVAPDVLVTRGIGRGERRTYRVWAEGKAPDVIIEISSKKTCKDDVQKKWRLYAELGVDEYFIFDPEYKYLPEPLLGYRLDGRWYTPLEPNADGHLTSRVLGLELVNTGETLRLFDPNKGQFLKTRSESYDALREAETENARLRAELARLRGADG
jgi:Uma2 family endonuclease